VALSGSHLSASKHTGYSARFFILISYNLSCSRLEAAEFAVTKPEQLFFQAHFGLLPKAQVPVGKKIKKHLTI